jgi:TonB-dependent receptor-like protein/carboxypeptidase family protein
VGRCLLLLVGVLSILAPRTAGGQGLTGTLIGTVTDDQGAVIAGALVQLRSPALIGGSLQQLTNTQGRMWFVALPPGPYVLEASFKGFSTARVDDIVIAAGATLERIVRLSVADRAESVVVEAAGSRIEARHPGFGTWFGPQDLTAIPTTRNSMFSYLRMAPGVSPTSPSSSTATTISALGGGTNENQYLIDGNNFTCPCNGIARSEPGIDFMQEIQIQSVGASAEYGNVQGAVINVVMKQGGEQFRYDASYYFQTAGLTSQPVQLPYGTGGQTSGYNRVRYRDFTTNFGGPALRNRVWFFAGYQYLRDYDSQPGTDPTFPRTYEQNKIAEKVNWKPGPGWQVDQSIHYEYWVNPETPTSTKPFETTQRRHASVPASTFGHLTHVQSDRTVWEVRASHFVHDRIDDPSSGIVTTSSRTDSLTKITSGGPPQLGNLVLVRTTAKATVNQYLPGRSIDHEWKWGGQIEQGESHGYALIPTGVRYNDRGGQPFEAVSSNPSLTGGQFVTAAAFVSDAITAGDRLTINAGVRFDHSRAISQDLHAVDHNGQETDEMVGGLGTLYSWNLVSPRLGVTLKLSADGRTFVRASYGRFSQGMLTGEYSAFHPGVSPTTTTSYDPATQTYTIRPRVVDPRVNLRLDSEIGAPHTDEYSIGFDREAGRRVAISVAYFHKSGTNFIGWTDIGGDYRESVYQLPDRTIPVFELVNAPADRRFLLTNPAGYFMKYDGVVMAVEKRRSDGWQATASYTWSKVSGLQASSGTTAGGAQSSSVALPTVPIGRDPNDLTNANGRLPNDRPHALRGTTVLDIPRTGLVFAANLQHFSGKPWAATAQIPLPQGDQRVLLELRGTRRLSSQTLLDLRISRTVRLGRLTHVDLIVDVLNALNDDAEEELASDNLYSSNFGQPNVFVDPRRAMIGVRFKLGR